MASEKNGHTKGKHIWHRTQAYERAMLGIHVCCAKLSSSFLFIPLHFSSFMTAIILLSNRIAQEALNCDVISHKYAVLL